MDATVKRIKDLISQNKIKEAIDLLLDYSESKSEYFKNAALALSAQFNNWRQREILDLANDRDINKIRVSILDLLLAESTESNLSGRENFRGKNKKSKSIVWLVGTILLVGIGITIILNTVDVFRSNSAEDYLIFDKKLTRNTVNEQVKINESIEKERDHEELKFTISGQGLEENDGTVFKYLTKPIEDNWSDYDTEQGDFEKIYYEGSNSWQVSFWHAFEYLKDGEEFKLQFLDSSIDTIPLFEYVFKVRHEQ